MAKHDQRGEKKNPLKIRQRMGHPLHGPPHQISDHTLYHVTAPCYEHKPIIGKSAEQMAEFERDLLEGISLTGLWWGLG